MTRRFRFGICTDQNMTWDKTVERWQLFESLCFESAWLCDHLIQPSRPTGPYFEAWSLLAGLAARTEKIRVGILVTSNTFRFPQIVAKMSVTVDHISNGRLEIGLGAGWYEPEHAMFGIPFPETKELVSRFKEAVQVVDLMTREDTSSFDGEYYQLRDACSGPSGRGCSRSSPGTRTRGTPSARPRRCASATRCSTTTAARSDATPTRSTARSTTGCRRPTSIRGCRRMPSTACSSPTSRPASTSSSSTSPATNRSASWTGWRLRFSRSTRRKSREWWRR